MKARRRNRSRLLLRRALMFRQSRDKTLLFLPRHGPQPDRAVAQAFACLGPPGAAPSLGAVSGHKTLGCAKLGNA